jgi:enterochelin esterase-like enzyme
MFTTDKLEAMFDGGLPETRGQWVEQHFYSQALGREDGYLVWLPPGYETSGRRYASLYLLHGVGGAEGYGVEEWLGYALTEDLDRMLALGMIEPMIVVLPNGEQGYWMNHSPDTDGTRWADFVATDLVKDVDAHFRTDPARERRAIGGLSMGGHGALQIAMNHPDEFSIVGAHSPTIRPYETSPEFFGDPQWFAKYDPISLAEHTDAASKLAIWIDIGNRDEEWLPMTEELDHILAAKQDAVQFHVLEGEHEGWYWEYYLPEYLNFYSSALNATAKTPKGAPVVVSRSLLASAGVVS